MVTSTDLKCKVVQQAVYSYIIAKMKRRKDKKDKRIKSDSLSLTSSFESQAWNTSELRTSRWPQEWKDIRVQWTRKKKANNNTVLCVMISEFCFVNFHVCKQVHYH